MQYYFEKMLVSRKSWMIEWMQYSLEIIFWKKCRNVASLVALFLGKGQKQSGIVEPSPEMPQHHLTIDLFNGWHVLFNRPCSSTKYVCLTVLYHVLLRGCSSNRVGNTLQRDRPNLQCSSRKGSHLQKKTVQYYLSPELTNLLRRVPSKKSWKQEKQTCLRFSGEMLHPSR